MPPAGYFLSPATESTQRAPPKPMVLESLRGRGAECIGTFHPRELNGVSPPCAFALSLLLSTATRSALVLPVQTRKIRAPTVFGASRTPPLRNSIVKRCVGADAPVRLPDLYRNSCDVSLRSQCAHWLWQSVPKAPLRKGSCHGAAVTEGSTTAPLAMPQPKGPLA